MIECMNLLRLLKKILNVKIMPPEPLTLGAGVKNKIFENPNCSSSVMSEAAVTVYNVICRSFLYKDRDHLQLTSLHLDPKTSITLQHAIC
jgi:hypothetical protein